VIQATLILLDVEVPIVIEVAGEANGSERDDGFSHLFGPAHAGTRISFGAVPAEVVGDCLQRFALGSRESAFDDTLKKSLNHLAHIA